MADLLTSGQPARRAVLNPGPVYSRVVNLELHVPAGLGASDWEVTPPLGQNIWLLGVRAWFFSSAVGVLIGGIVRITAGTGVNLTEEIVATRWEPIIENYGGAKTGLYWHSDKGSFAWQMRRLYTGQARRFGCVIENFDPEQHWVALVSFEISEG